MADYGYEGAGDRQRYNDGPQFERVSLNYVKRRFSNGLPVPVFLGGLDENENNVDSPWHSCHNLPASIRGSGTSTTTSNERNQKSLPEVIREYLSCPICKDPCIEATSTNCGHKFCKDCLEKWRKEKPVCPICSALISYTHRVYSDDQMIESQLENFPSELQGRYKRAQRKRMDALLKERDSQTSVGRLCRKWTDSVMYLRCKNRETIQAGLVSKLGRIWNSVRDWRNNHRLAVGIFLGIMLTLLAMHIWSSVNTTFFGYVWLAAKNYDGTIPESWLKGQPEPGPGEMSAEGVNVNEEDDASTLENLILHKLPDLVSGLFSNLF